MNYNFKKTYGYVMVGIILMPTFYILVYKLDVPHANHIGEKPFPIESRQLYVSGISSTMSVSDSSSHII